jgi:hydrogenase maturation protein HypF
MSGDATKPLFQALVMTSGNLSEEPIVHDNDEAIKKLSGIVDAFLLHNRDIFMRVDDSVVRIWTGGREDAGTGSEKEFSTRRPITASPRRVLFVRRARGYSPEPIALHDDGPEVLGCGADLKNTFTLTKGAFAVPSQHIGDMENVETLNFFEESLENLKSVYRVNPVAIVHDLHPGYLSTRWAMGQETGDRSQESGGKNGQEIKCIGIQHHYAHIGSVMAENGLRNKVIGVAFDGTGYGTDGNLWGGEFLIAGIYDFERAGQFKYIPLPGGESAIREPWRTALSYIFDAAGKKAGDYLERIGFNEKYGKREIEKLATIIGLREFSPLSSGAGRLFDAVSAMLRLCDRNTFEGEAAIALESLVDETIADDYPVEFKKENRYSIVDFSQTIIGILEDVIKGTAKKIIATQFHNTISAVIVTIVKDLSKRHGLTDVALSGGTFQNLYLLNRTERLLTSDGMNVFFNQKVPSNDAGISLGQAYIVRERLRK